MRALTDGVRDDAIQADGREREGDDGEDANEGGVESLRSHGGVDVFLQWANGEDGKLTVGLANRGVHRSR